jgi:glutamate synthase (ferredoxin)
VVLGPTGRNFAAGMSGGVAWVLDEGGDFAARCNTDLVSLTPIESSAEAARLKDLVRRHADLTRSAKARRILDTWDTCAAQFVRVMPNDYRRVLEAQARMRETGLPEDEAVMAAFEENARNLARAGGN